MEKNKRGIFFSIDALIALAIILLIILIAVPILDRSTQETELHYDILSALSTLKVSDIDNSFVQELVTNNTIKDTDKTILEQVGEFYVTDQNLARAVASEVLIDVESNENIGIWYEDTLIWSRNDTPFGDAENIYSARQTISGIKNGTNITGFSARAFLSSNATNTFIYFGGYIGDGNITTIASYNGNISSAVLELVINNDFELIINNNSLGTYTGSPDDFTPVTYTLGQADLLNFQPGNNTIEFKGESLHIAGGFIKISYTSDTAYQQPQKYNFPGIDGLINLYDGFYIPGELTELNIVLHFNSTFETFLNFGNITVYNGTTFGNEQTISINDSELMTLLDYNDISKETVPIRLGLRNVSLTTVNNTIDAVSVTDLSGSMDNCGLGFWCCEFYFGSECNQTQCENPWPPWQQGGGCGLPWTGKLESAQAGNRILVETVLNTTGNNVSLIGYDDEVLPDDSYHLTNNNATLHMKINNWTDRGSTCICCGINGARDEIVANSTPGNDRIAIVMSDGIAVNGCAEQGVTGDLNNNNVSDDAGDDAIQAACDAKNNYNITIHSIAFGDNADNQTMIEIAACGGGTFFSSSVEDLVNVYQEIGNTITGTFTEQTLNSSIGHTVLYPDSHISFTYVNESITTSGLILTVEKQFDNETGGNFSLAADSEILETRLASYSGPRWTDKATINGETIYNLSSYTGLPFIEMGDPYFVNIANEKVTADNTITLTTGLGPGNSTVGSAANKIIYTVNKNLSSFSPILIAANGCTWHIQFEDDTNLITNIPQGYGGTEDCYYAQDGFFNQSGGPQYPNANDAFQVAVFNLLSQLDLDSNEKIDIKLSDQDLQITLANINGIPFGWSTEVQIRVWR